MEIIGLDLHKRESQLAIQAEDGTITDRRIATNRERFTAVLGVRPRPRPRAERRRCARIRSITAASVMKARMRIAPPQAGQVSGSTS